MNYEDIIKLYKEVGTMQDTARIAKCSHGCVKKTLVTAGIIKTPLTERIAELRRTGMSQLEISKFLGISDTCVNVNSPYEKCQYISDIKSDNALRVSRSKERKRKGIKNTSRKVDKHGIKIANLHKASGATKSNPNGYSRITYNIFTREISVSQHTGVIRATRTDNPDHNVIHVCDTNHHLTMQQIADAVRDVVVSLNIKEGNKK